MTWLQILAWCAGGYLALGVASVWIAHKDLITDKWWAWIVVVFIWPLFWWKLFA